MKPPEEALQDAAVAWWRSHRPVGYSEVEHLDNPRVNCSSGEEKRLAIAVAGFLKERARLLRAGK